MVKYLFAYHGDWRPEGKEEYEAVVKDWESWLTEFGTSIIDAGNPVGPNLTVESDGTITKNGGSNPITGYGIFKASTSAEATKIAKKCPILSTGGSVEFAEIFDVSQSG